MKKNIITLILIAGFTITGFTLFAQVPPPPPSEHGATGNKDSGGGAPIGSGVAVLLTLGAAYGAKKVYDLRKKLDE